MTAWQKPIGGMQWGPARLATTAWIVVGLAGCAEKMADDRAATVLNACCEAARERIATTQDIETARFQTRCAACRTGNSKAQCEAAASHVQTSVKQAFGSELWPVECSTLRSQLEELGISIPENR